MRWPTAASRLSKLLGRKVILFGLPAALPTVGGITVNSGGKLVLGTFGSYGAPGQLVTMNGGTIEIKPQPAHPDRVHQDST